MCGICGAVDFGAPEGPSDAIARMTATLGHRGPDASGVHTQGPVALGHTRLSIIDLSDAGAQPMASPDGRVVMVYNGEVYNFPELRAELETAGHVFRGHSDSEVVLHAWLEWGSESFSRLNGMFAIALWDEREQALTLARDRYGIKPLHFHHARDRIVFGSEIKAILAHGGVEARLEPGFLQEYLYFGNSLLEQTAFAGVRKLLPGHWLRFDRSGLREVRYHDLAALPEEREVDLEEATERVRHELDAAVRRHLIADVPVAVFLSGGIDSSAVATLATRHHDGKLRTYTAGFEQGEDVDERPRARRLADALGTDHRELHVGLTGLPDVLRALVRAHDEPFADAANIPLYLLSRRLREEGIKVVLQGDGGDELFAGYRRYNVLAERWFWRLVAPAGRVALGLAPGSPRVQRGLRFLRAIGERDPALRMALMLTMEDAAHPPTRVLHPDVGEEYRASDPFRAYRELAPRVARLDEVSRMLRTDCLLLLPDTFLAKVDRPTMANSIEVRVPFLDAALEEAVVALPAHCKVRRLQKKFLLRRALRGTVPDEILDGPKRGLSVPYSRWLRTDLREMAREMLLDPAAPAGGLLHRPTVERALLEHQSGVRDEGFLLYKLLQLALWHEAYLAG